ncbi:MAG: potassium transporter [Alphaproteobacteria bacterium]|nr:potassium transporter [Alphaproteobacteria bacterium]
MTDFLLLAFTFLIAGVIAVPIATRLGLGSVLGYLLAGMAISPLLNWLGVDVISIQQFAEFGVVMMLFLVGLELEPKMLWKMRTRLIGLGGLQVTVSVAAIAAVAMAFGQPLSVGITIGFIMTLSSTAIVLQTLNEKGLTKSEGGQGSFIVLLFQDIAVIPMLSIIPLLALPELLALGAENAASGAGEGEEAASLSLVANLVGWQVALVTAGAVGAVILMGHYLTRPLFRFIARAGLRELFVATALMIVVGIALLTSLVGLSPALGAFLGGVVLANSEYRHELESDIDPFRGLLLGLFFMTVGAAINFNLLAENFILLIVLTLILMVVKVAVLWGLGVLFKIRGSDRWLMALSVAQAGEFGFVLISFSVVSSAISTELASMLSLIVAMSMLFTPLLFIIHDKLIAKHFSGEQERATDEMDEDKPIIIAGRGRVGGIVDRILTAAGYETTVIDFSSKQLDDLRVFGVDKVFFGDATRPDLLHAAGVHKAELLVIALDSKEDITRLVRYMRQNYPDLHVVARGVDRHHVYELWEAGCRDIIRETFDSSIRMGRSALEALGHERPIAQAMVNEFEAMDRIALREMADVYDSSLPATENEAYISRITETRDERHKEFERRMREAARGGAPEDEAVEPGTQDGPQTDR